MLQVGSTIDGWNIDALIHQGSMAVTYAVSHAPRPKQYAMKVLFLQEPSFQERLRRSGEALRSIRHPHLVPIVDVVQIDGKVAVISEFIEGTNLSAWSEQGERTLTDQVQLFRKACQGLRAAHAHGLVHRNLKPAKILVDLTDHPYIHDFMLGKMMNAEAAKAVTQMGTTFGTPQYMAPEQFRGASAVDERADVFSMGCILFEMVTGRRAFDGVGVVEIYQQVASGDRPKVHDLREDCPEALEALVEQMLCPDPEERVASIKQLVSRLDGDADLRQLVNPSFRTATPVSALTSDRPVKKAVALEAPANQSGPPRAVSVTPVDPPRGAPVPDASHRKGPAPSPSDPTSPVHDLLGNRMAEGSQDSRPSLITFTDGTSEESQLQSLGAGMAMPRRQPTPSLSEPSLRLSPAMIVGGLALLFLVAMGVGLLVANL